MGMLATVMNSLALCEALEQLGVKARVMSAVAMQPIAEQFVARDAVKHLENGEVVISIAAVAYVKASVIEVPDGYVKPTKDVMFDEGATEATVTVEIDTRVIYRVILVDEEGNGIADVLVGISDNSGCKTPVATDANGVSLQKLTINGEAKVQFVMLEGYEVVSPTQDADGYVHFADGETEITITLRAV